MNDSSLIHRLSAEVTTADADFMGRLRTGALVNLLLQGAVKSADELGFGLAFLRENSLFWVLSRLSVEISASMKWRDRLTVETWPRDIDGFYYLRDFIIRNHDGEAVVRATSAWLAIGLERKRPVRLSEENNDLFTKLRNLSSGVRELPVLHRPDAGPDQLKRITPCYFDLDLNGHVTTTRYIDWIMDSFPLGFHRDHRPSVLDINFMKEVLPGDTVELDHFRLEDEDFFEGRIEGLEKPAFRASVRWTVN